MHILYVACNSNANLYREDGSFIYRCENVGLALLELGFTIEFCHLRDLSPTKKVSVMIFHRPKFSLRLISLIYFFKLRGVRIWADFDDLIFDPDYTAFSPAILNRLKPYDNIYSLYKSHQKALFLVDKVFFSTQALLEHFKKIFPGKECIWLPNAVHINWLSQLKDTSSSYLASSDPVITYLPGSKSHDRDFEVFLAPLQDFLADFKYVKLQITGPLAIKFAMPAAQLIHKDRVNFADYHNEVKQAWVNLAPLEDTPFTRCKSALKVIEGAYWGKPTICSKLPDAERLKDRGAIIVSDTVDVYAYLKKLLDESFYQHYSQQLRAKILEVADVRVIASTVVKLIDGSA